MKKLYQRGESGTLRYHEAWISDDGIVEHWGQAGTAGAHREHRRDTALDEEADLERILAPARQRGFATLDDDDLHVLLIEYPIEEMGSAEDLDKRHALEEEMDEFLGWTGLGHCDGGDIGSGTMNVLCFVVDFELAESAIVQELTGTVFGDFGQIHRG